MRTALLAVAALTAGGLAVPVSMTGAGAAGAAGAAPATMSVSGTLTPIHASNGPDRYALSLPGGTLVPVSLDRPGEIEKPQTFTGDLAIPPAVARRAEALGATVAAGDDIAAASSDGRRVLAAASTSTEALPVRSATLSPQKNLSPQSTRAAQTSSAGAHRLYLAVITNRGSNEAASSIADKTAAMRSYWVTNSDGVISSFTQSGDTVGYASSTATAANHCGLSGDTSLVWNEAAAKFPGVDFSTAGNHLMVVAPASCAAGAVGIGTIGSSIRSGGRTIVTLGGTGVAVGVHELGHNLSLEHANAERCASACTTQEYRDLYSIMGLAVSGGDWTPDSLDTSYRVQTGIASSAEVPTVTATSTVHLNPRGSAAGVRGVLVTDPATGARYSVEYRSGTGRDATAFYATGGTKGRNIGGYTYRPGVVVERIEGDYDSTMMMTFASGGTYVTSYAAGQSFARGHLTIAVEAASPDSGADVTVTLGAAVPSSSGTFTPGTPRIVGTPRVGQRLVVGIGDWAPRPERVRVQWRADGQPVAGATGAGIVLTRALLGRRISVLVTADRRGYASASRTSEASAPVAAGRFVARQVRVTGHAKVGRVLVATTGTWSPRPRFSYRWYANGRTIAKATGRTLKVTKSLRGKRIAVRVTARQAGYRASAVSSGRTATVR